MQYSFPQKSEKLVFDKLSILQEVEKNGVYQDNTSIIKKWEEEDGSNNMFILETIQPDIPKFLGVVNGMFEREGYAVNSYSNGDKYFGYYSEDERNKHGFYSYAPIISEENGKCSEYYFGLWRDDLRDDHGVYLWLYGEEDFKDFDNSSFQAYVGDFENDAFSKGTLMSKYGEEYFVYHGGFSESGLKEGENCFYFSASLEQLLYGTFKEDTFVQGFVAKFDDNGNLLKIIKKIGDYIEEGEDENELEKEEWERASLACFNFRNIIMSKDYFGEVYKIFGDTVEFRDNVMTDVDVLNSEKYIDIMNATIAYNKATISKDIEKVVEGI